MDVNIWGMLGCAVGYAAALFAIVDALGDFLANRQGADRIALNALRLKTGGKVGASGLTVVTAAVVLLLDNNLLAFLLFTVIFAAISLWVFYIFRESAAESAPVSPR